MTPALEKTKQNETNPKPFEQFEKNIYGSSCLSASLTELFLF